MDREFEKNGLNADQLEEVQGGYVRLHQEFHTKCQECGWTYSSGNRHNAHYEEKVKHTNETGHKRFIDSVLNRYE